MKRNNFLDVLKGICILLVILTHFDWVEPERLKYLFPFWMNPAVPIFMIISGYVFAESFKRKDVSTFKEAYNLKGIVDKVIRYTVPLIIIYAIEVPVKLIALRQPIRISELVTQFFLGGYGPGSYYYPYMIEFIFLFPLIYFAIKKWDFRGLVLCGAANIFYEVIKVPMGMTAGVFRLIVLRYIFAIAFGCYISMGKMKLKKWMGIASFIFGAVFIYIVCYTGYKPVFFYRWSRTSMLAVFYIAPIAYLLITRCKWECKPLALMGKASYNIFFAQMAFFHIVNSVIDGIPGTPIPMLITYVCCIALGILFYKIETPITKKVLSWNAKLFEKKA